MDVHEDPRWIRVLAFAIAAAVAAFGSVGLLLAVLGWYGRLAVLVAGSAVFAGLCLLARPVILRRGDVGRDAHAGAVLALVAIAGLTVWNVSNASQQVLVIRDGGTYLNAGKWVSAHGTLEVEPFTGPFSTTTGLAASSAGMSRDGRHLDFTLAHMFPVLLAEAQGLGGDGLMYAAVAILGGAALLAFYLLARRVLAHPLAALGATLCLGVLMPQVAFSRDSTTEIPMQVLLFTGAWMLCDRRTLEHRGPAFAAGLFLGLLQAIHIDGLAFVVGLPFVAGASWLRAEAADRRRVLGSILAAGAGVAAGLALGFFDLARRSSHYLRSLRFDVQRLSVATAIAAIAAIAVAVAVRSWSSRPGSGAGLRRVRQPAGWLVAAVVLVGGFGAWLVRPSLQTVRAGKPSTVVAFVQRATHLAPDPTRRYFEHSVEWTSWYLGPVTLALAIVGAAYAAHAAVHGRLRVPGQVVALLLAPPALLYLWRPSITPDQIWVMRRFLPAVFPVLVLAAFGALGVLAARAVLGRRVAAPGARRAVAAALGVLAVAFPVYTIRNVSRMTQQRGFPTAVEQVCHRVGPRAAIIVPQEPAPLTWLYDPQTLRSFCNVPVAIMTSGQRSAFAPRLPDGTLDSRALRALAREWANDKRQLFVVAGTRRTIAALLPGVRVRVIPARRNPHLLDQTLVSRPDGYHVEQLSFAVAAVPAA